MIAALVSTIMATYSVILFRDIRIRIRSLKRSETHTSATKRFMFKRILIKQNEA